MLLVLNNKPGLVSTTMNIVALKNWQKLSHAVGVWTMGIIAPNFIITFPVKDARSIIYRRTTQVDTFAMQKQTNHSFHLTLSLYINHTQPHPAINKTLFSL